MNQEYYKGTTKQQFKLRQEKTFNNPENYKGCNWFGFMGYQLL